MTERIEHPSFRGGLRAQSGAAFLVLVLMLAVAAVSIIIVIAPGENNQLAAAQKTAQALAAARDAVIGFAASAPDSARLGDLPCPATSYSTGDAASSCNTAASRIGYLPWRTLGLPDLRDGSGAPLLYAVSNGFKNNTRIGILNSDTAGEFTVAGENAIAIVFAPGSPIGNQDRSVATFNVANFLELGNADGDTTFLNSPESSDFNDRLLWITPRAFFPPLEMRALRVAQERLQHYFTVTGRYPRSNRYVDDFSCWTYGGRLPFPTPGNPCLEAGNGASEDMWTMAWPGWFFFNYWDYVIHYAVAPPCSAVGSVNCNGSGSFLTVNGTDNYRVLLIRQGIPNGQTRPCSLPSQCLDDGENSDSDRNYVTPVAGNDRMTIVSP